MPSEARSSIDGLGQRADVLLWIEVVKHRTDGTERMSGPCPCHLPGLTGTRTGPPDGVAPADPQVAVLNVGDEARGGGPVTDVERPWLGEGGVDYTSCSADPINGDGQFGRTQ